MQGIESAIRNALTKADANDPAARQRIYESVWSTHERAMAANTHLNEQQRLQRRDQLQAIIIRIEQDMRGKEPPTPPLETTSASNQDPIVPPIQVPASATNDVHNTPQPSNSQMVPELDPADIRSRSADHQPIRRSAGRQPTSDRHLGHAIPEADLGFESGISRPKHRKPRKASALWSLGLPVLVLISAGLIGWSIYNSLTSPIDPRHNPLLQSGNLNPQQETELLPASQQWTTIFTPQQPALISVQGKATAAIEGDDKSAYARITSPSKDDTISFDIGEGTLNQIIGKQAIFDITVRGSDDTPTQIAINCDFGVANSCGRKRYDVTGQLTNLLFDVDLSNGKKSSRSGQLTLHTDILGSGNSVDVYLIRVRVKD